IGGMNMNNQLRRRDKRNYYPSVFGRFSDDFFNNMFSDSELPATNVSETEKAYNLELSVPGFSKEDFKIEVDKNVMKISASKENNTEEKGEDEKVWRREFTSSSFTRSFVLPENVDTEKITANEKSGILKISLPKMDKAPEDQVKKNRNSIKNSYQLSGK
ncbi:MAG: Hsp20/alpha crystallin family protein, partial [Bacteroidales bacterium]|nr:Hsp20/alpha crystallin family protein [Bacteroidales bacterium]